VIRTEATAGGRVRVVTLDRSERRNALDAAALDALEAALADPPSVVAIEGAGAAFCAGADLDWVARVAERAAEGDPGAARDLARRGQRVARAIEECEAVVVAAIDGPARGGGVELALACDLRVASPDADAAEPGVTFGLFGAWGGTHRLPRVVGPSAAADLALSGRVIDAEAARRVGLVSRVVPEPLAVAEEVAAAAPLALRRLVPLIREGGRAGVDRAAHERREAEAFAALVADHADALARRAPGASEE
jgi:enoyl-CoA hydratase/carnithine racemase